MDVLGAGSGIKLGSNDEMLVRLLSYSHFYASFAHFQCSTYNDASWR